MRPSAAVLTAIIGFGTMMSPGVSHAELGKVEVGFQPTAYQKAGTGYLATAGCRALATGVEAEVVAVSTQVVCSIGANSRTAAAPGPLAETFLTAATESPITFCVTGTAVFLDMTTNDLFTVTEGPNCAVFGTT